MGAEAQIPIIDFFIEDLKLGLSAENGSCHDGDLMQNLSRTREKNDIRSRVREACEMHGCFLLRCKDDDTKRLTEDMLEGMKSLFDLPDDVKMRYKSSRPYSSYKAKGDKVVPLQESFGIDEAHLVKNSQGFTNLIWPQGNPEFCSVMNGMSSRMLQLNLSMLKLIFESYGAGNCYESFAEKISSVFRVMKYNVPPSGAAIGLVPHTDKNALTILFQNDVQGLEIMSKDGIWTPLVIPQGCFLVNVGDTMKVWSNGRMHSVKHKVTISGNKDRYSCGLFTVPKDGGLVEVAKELVDNEHPILYKSFPYKDYLSYFMSNTREDALETYAGVSSLIL